MLCLWKVEKRVKQVVLLIFGELGKFVVSSRIVNPLDGYLLEYAHSDYLV